MKSLSRGPKFRIRLLAVPVVGVALVNASCAQNATPSSAPSETADQKLLRLTAAVSQVQLQMSAVQNQLRDLQSQLASLRQQIAAESGSSSGAPSPPMPVPENNGASALSEAVDELRDRQDMQASEIETHEQSKVETDSKYRLKVSGLVLFTGSINTRQVDNTVDPTYAAAGGGSTSFSMRQTLLGLDADGPHPFGASTHGDVRVDFFASGAQSGSNFGLLRLRTAHATLTWPNTKLFFALDRSLLAPNAPTSLVANAQPEFAWSGNLWTWNPQLGVSQKLALSHAGTLKLEAALIDAMDPHFPGNPTATYATSETERSRWPGTEARVALSASAAGNGPELGLGGYFSPHETTDHYRFNAWAASMDLRLPLTRYLELSSNTYRGAALGSLGGGGYSNYVVRDLAETDTARALDDVGGWAQLKGRAGERLELNAGYGIDNPFAGEIRSTAAGAAYPGLSRNWSAFANAIYSPSAYFLFSLEYRRLGTNYVTRSASYSDQIGIAAGYRF